MWLVHGFTGGLWMAGAEYWFENRPVLNTHVLSKTMLFSICVSMCYVSFYAAPAIGGFVVVGQMLVEFGSCTRT
jgi:hypothetical protein